MSKEIYISSTPHETRLAIVENDELTEIYYERENEYTLAGSIYNGRVTRVLPGMQSSFVDIGLERDAFLYITDFMEEAGDSADFDHGDGQKAPRTLEGQRGDGQSRDGQSRDGQSRDGQRNGRGDRNGQDRGGSTYVSERNQEQASATPASDFAQASDGRGDEFGNRGERGGNDRGGRNRGRGRRDRGGDRQGGGERTASPVETPPFGQTAPEVGDEFEDVPVAQAGFDGQTETPGTEVGEGAPGADGSRRWRGRRGRRRGRGTGPRPDGPSAAPVAGEGVVSSEPAGEDEFDEAASFDIDGSAVESVSEPIEAAPVDPVVSQPQDGQRRDRGGRDRDRGGRNDRSGRGDRGDRGQGAPRVPRGFAPRGFYGIDSAPEAEAVASPVDEAAVPEIEPLILPGESLGKYRKGGEETSAPKASAASTALPDSGITIVGWDGGAALPGETLSRHRGGSQPSASQGRGGERSDFRRNEGGRDGRDGRNRGGRDQRQEPQGGMMVPATMPGRDLQSAGPVQGYAHATESAEEVQQFAPDFTHAQLPEATAEAPHADSKGESSVFGNEGGKDVEFVDAAQLSAPEKELEQEYEPEEASASYRIDPAARSEYRQSAPAAPEVEEFEVPVAEHHQDLETAPSGEVFAAEPQHEAFEQHGGTVEEIFASPEVAEAVEFSEPQSTFHEVETHEEAIEQHDVTLIEPTGEMVEVPSTFHAVPVVEAEERFETEEAEASPMSLLPHGVAMTPTVYGDEEVRATEAVQLPQQPVLQHFEPGAGDLEEDFIEEEEEFEPHHIQARAEEFADSEEQEPLEGAADLGSMIREMSIDHITRTEASVSEDEEGDEDFEEDTLEEDEFDEEGFESSGADEIAEDSEDAHAYAETEQTEGGHEFSEDRGFHPAQDSDPSYVAEDGQARSDRGASTEGSSTANGNGDSRRRREGGRRGDRRGGRGDRDRSGNRESAPRTETRPDTGFRNEGSDRSSGYSDRTSSSDRGSSERSGPDRSGLGERARNTGGGGDRDRGRSGGGRGGRQSMQMTNLPAISELLKPGQEILCQIAKEPIAKKGARITSHIALPGRFLVFMPTVSHTGVSRKIESDAERRRLKEILLSEKGEAAGGFIVRTAAAGASEEELRSDLRFLLNLWTDIKQRSESSKSPALIYHDLNLVERILRDQVTDTFSAIWVDTETEYERVLRFLQRFQPSLIRRVKLYTKETPLFEQFGITEEINKALRSKVWLKSGGSIVINQTEALVAIDINTGKFVGKTARLEDTIVKTNLDAIPEIVRQIRLRDLGGIIIIDFIDMDERKNRNRVMAALEEELKTDRAPSKVLPFNDFGLVAITRKRVKQSLERTLSTTCNVCTGTGMVKSPVTVCNDIYIEMRKMHKHLDRGDVMLRVHPEVVKQLKLTGSKWLQEMEEMCGKTILIKSDPSLHPEQFDIH